MEAPRNVRKDIIYYRFNKFLPKTQEPNYNKILKITFQNEHCAVKIICLPFF